MSKRLLVIILGIVVRDVEVTELVHALGRGNNVNVVTELLLLQVLLGEVLEVTLGERKLSSDEDLGLLTGEGDLVAELASLAVDLDALKEETLELSALEEAILEWDRVVDGELGELLGGILSFDLKGRPR